MLEFERLFIGNEWLAPASDATLEVRSPANLEVVGVAPDASATDIGRAVTAARDAFDEGRS